MKRTDPRLIADIINESMAQAGLTDTYEAYRISALWPEVVGPGINRYTMRRYVEGHTMHVYITSAALKNELSFCRQQLVDALNRAAGRQTIDTIIIH